MPQPWSPSSSRGGKAAILREVLEGPRRPCSLPPRTMMDGDPGDAIVLLARFTRPASLRSVKSSLPSNLVVNVILVRIGMSTDVVAGQVRVFDVVGTRVNVANAGGASVCHR